MRLAHFRLRGRRLAAARTGNGRQFRVAQPFAHDLGVVTAKPPVQCPLCHSSKVSIALDTPVRTDYRCDYCGKRWTVTAADRPGKEGDGDERGKRAESA
jgi:hypothetical protein